MTILLTGAAGFIGSNLTQKLLKEGHTVLGYDNFDAFYERRIKKQNISLFASNQNFKLFEADILSSDKLDEVFNNNRIDVVIHLAAKAGVRPSIIDPVGYFNVNLNGTLNILESMKRANVKKLIFASSSSVYGNNEKVPFSETDIVDFPISPYAASKKAGELLCHTYHHLYGFDVFCLRFFTVYGPSQRPDLAIHKFTKALINKQEIPFYGDGSTKRDYTHINDIVNGIEGAIANLKGFNVFNLGESKTTSLAQLISYLEESTGEKAILNKLPMQPGDVELTYADTSKARKLINYNPTIDIKEGLKDFVDWYRNNESKQS